MFLLCHCAAQIEQNQKTQRNRTPEFLDYDYCFVVLLQQKGQVAGTGLEEGSAAPALLRSLLLLPGHGSAMGSRVSAPQFKRSGELAAAEVNTRKVDPQQQEHQIGKCERLEKHPVKSNHSLIKAAGTHNRPSGPVFLVSQSAGAPPPGLSLIQIQVSS